MLLELSYQEQWTGKLHIQPNKLPGRRVEANPKLHFILSAIQKG